MKRLVLIACVGLTGCATAQWSHSSKGAAEFEQDKADCVQYASQVSGGMGLGFNPIFVQQQAQECLRRKGWSTN